MRASLKEPPPSPASREAIIDACDRLGLAPYGVADANSRDLYLDWVRGGCGCEALMITLEGSPSRIFCLLERASSPEGFSIVDLTDLRRPHAVKLQFGIGESNERRRTACRLLATLFHQLRQTGVTKILPSSRPKFRRQQYKKELQELQIHELRTALNNPNRH